MENKKLAILTKQVVIKGIKQYEASTTTPTYRGFLLWLGLGHLDYVELVALAQAGDIQAMEVLRELDMFKLKMEVFMEELMLYQSKHPAMEGQHYFNYGHLKELLKWSNPSYYGDKQAAMKQIAQANLGYKGEEQLVDLVNNSEVKWLK